jgi:predicted Fe-S protein YdhL (DUF1289 family)
MTPSASSPCIRVCKVDRVSGLCTGCGRTVAEIASWGAIDERARLAIMAELPDRMRLAARPASRCSPGNGPGAGRC